jgi:hypothetical protein
MEFQQNQQVKTTTQYWGYRELSAEELQCVGGGDDSDRDAGDSYGGNSNTSNTGNTDASLGMCSRSEYSISSAQAEALANSFGGITKGGWEAVNGLLGNIRAGIFDGGWFGGNFGGGDSGGR